MPLIEFLYSYFHYNLLVAAKGICYIENELNENIDLQQYYFVLSKRSSGVKQIF